MNGIEMIGFIQVGCFFFNLNRVNYFEIHFNKESGEYEIIVSIIGDDGYLVLEDGFDCYEDAMIYLRDLIITSGIKCFSS